MSAYFAAGKLSEEEKQDILSQHREIYNGYQTMQPKVSNTQPLYVQDFAKDKVGAVISNKGVVKPYTNVGINEQVEESKEVCDECGAMEMSEEKEMCSECGGMMQEGECSECGWKGEVGDMDEHWQDGDPQYKRLEEKDEDGPSFIDQAKDFVLSNPEILMALEEKNEDEPEICECGGKMYEGVCNECGSRYMDEATGNLDDIYHEEDLDPSAEFDYVKGASNKTNAYHIKEDDGDDYVNYDDNFEDPDNEDDGFEDINASEVTDEIEEEGYTGGGNAPDMDLSNIDPAYDFVSDGPGDVYPTEGEMDEEWEQMESAWADEMEENDISGVQGLYGDMDPAYDFDSEGPGKAGPYQHSQWGGGSVHDKKIEHGYEGEDEDAYWEKDLDDDELDLDLSKFNPEDKSWEEISDYTGDDEFSHVDEDIRESVIQQKNKIMEMMNRMKVIK